MERMAEGCVEDDFTLLFLPLISGKDDYKPLPENKIFPKAEVIELVPPTQHCFLVPCAFCH